MGIIIINIYIYIYRKAEKIIYICIIFSDISKKRSSEITFYPGVPRDFDEGWKTPIQSIFPILTN